MIKGGTEWEGTKQTYIEEGFWLTVRLILVSLGPIFKPIGICWWGSSSVLGEGQTSHP